MWNYRIMKKHDPHMDEDVYVLTEVFYEYKTKKPMAYSEREDILASSPEEIVAVLEMMLKDAMKEAPILTEADFRV
jgi:hypothetical protein